MPALIVRRDAFAQFAARKQHINVQLNVEIPAPLRQALKAEADRRGVTLTRLVEEALTTAVPQTQAT